MKQEEKHRPSPFSKNSEVRTGLIKCQLQLVQL